MRSFLALAIASVTACTSALADGKPFEQKFADSTSSDALKVLFVGNSLFYAGELPEVFAALVKAQDSTARLKVTEVGGSNYALSDHLKEKLAQETIQQHGPWDVVILGEQSSKAYNNVEECFPDAKAFDTMVRAVKARPVIFEVWTGSSNQDYYYDHEACKKLVAFTKEEAVPAGTALMYANQYKIKTDLLDKDNHHLGKGGLYLVACVLYAKLYRRSPEGLPYKLYGTSEERKGQVIIDLPPAQAHQLQNIAWRTACAPWK